jgi:predicted kinase
MADVLLRAGWSVIVDATFLKRADRDAFRVLARETGATFNILAPHAPTEVLRARILARNALQRDASEATLEVLEHQLQTLEPLGPEESISLLGLLQ